MWLLARLLWSRPEVSHGGPSDSEQEEKPPLLLVSGDQKAAAGVMNSEPAETGNAPGCEEFNALDLLRHLQENEGYEVYEFFEAAKGRKGSRVLAPRRVWVEALETAPVASSGGAAPSEPSSGSCAIAVDSDPWIVLTSTSLPLSSAPAPNPPRPKGQGKGKAPPMPARAQAKGRPTAKAKGVPRPAAPPPFGKRLHWKALADSSLEDTIFEELREKSEVEPPLNKEQLERLFSPAPRAAPRASMPSGGSADGSSAGAAPKGKGGAPRGSEICLLDAKRAQNLAIVLRQVTLPTEELAEVLRCMRVGHQVTADTLEHVYDNLVPSLLECTELVNYDGATENLRDVEKKLIPLARLPRLKTRLATMLFSKKMPTLHRSLLARIRLLRSACEQVRNSSALRRIMKAGLRVGNYLNHGIEAPSSDEVRGFAVESLLKFRDFRATQGGEASALHCIVAHLCPHHPDLLKDLKAELQAVLESCDGAEVGILDGGISDIHDAASRFQSEIDLVQGEMDRFADHYRAEGEGPVKVLQQLVEDGREMATCLEEELRTTLATARRLLEYFGDRQQGEGFASETYTAVEKFFCTIRDFVSSFEDCWRDVLENPKKLRLEGFALSSGSGSETTPSSTSASITKPSPKAAAAAACAASAAGAANERRARQTGRLCCDRAESPADASAGGQCAIAVEAANAAMRRRKTTGMLRDFGAARGLLPTPMPLVSGD